MQNPDDFLRDFERGFISKSDWTHQAHIYMAWCYLNRYGSWQKLLPRVREGILRLNQSHGVLNGYHETITVAYLCIIEERLQKAMASSAENAWKCFQEANPDLFTYNPPIFLQYYQRETVFSDEARQRFVQPDLVPLPGQESLEAGR